MDNIFAEIEYTVPPSAAEKRLSSIPAQTISQRAVDPIREKFYAMRRLASDNPHTWKMPSFFYKQARFMKDFTDDYAEHIPFTIYYPCYQHMGYEQLRTYFTWRTKARNGEYPPTSLSYIFIYIYELLCGINVSNPAAGPEMLMALWNACREQAPALDKYLPGWLKDYHIYYALPGFKDFVNEHSLQRHYPKLLFFEPDAENSLEIWNNVSNYKITKSKFYDGDNIRLLKDCFYAVLSGIRTFCVSRNIRFEDLFLYETYKKIAWYPFNQALFYNWLQQPDRKVQIFSETYHIQNNQWSVDISMYHSGLAVLVGYIIKKTEACLRQAVKYKYKITADHTEINRSYQKLEALGITLADLDHVIADAVARFHYDKTRTIVTVSRDNLTRIREEALGTQEKLIVQDEMDASRNVLPGSLSVSDVQGTLPEPLNTSAGQSILPEPQATPDGWSDLRDVLNTTEHTALTILLNEDIDIQASIKSLADEKGIMLEVLADGINEKAMDHIGDNILEMADTMTVYEEYKEKIVKMVG